MKVDELNIDPRIIEILKAQGMEEFYPPQAEAIPYVLKGENLVLAAPTASGKSLVAYLAVLNSVLSGGKAMYIVPLRALASEKLEDFQAFEKLGLKVGISVGDYDSPDTTLEKFDIVIATSEKADSLLRHKSHWLGKLSVVVADEVHLINDGERGPTLEVTLAKFKQINPKAQIIALSATIQNSEELANWLNAKHIKSGWRPVPLKEGIYFSGKIYFTDNSEKDLLVAEDKITTLVDDVIKDGGQCLIFVNTRKSTETVAEKLGRTIKKIIDGGQLTQLKEMSKEMLANQAEPTSIGRKLAHCIKNGVAFHNAGLTNEQRKMVEKNFKEGKIKCIVATPTLAAGINVPARRVIIRDLKRFDETMGYSQIPVLEIKQMCGRAGRPKYDTMGEAILLAETEEEKEIILQNYLLTDTEKIYSKLGTEPALRTHILSSIATKSVTNEEELYKFIRGTFFAYQGDIWTIENKIEKVLEFLEENGLIIRGEEMKATLFGKRTSDLYIDPLSAIKLKKALENIRRKPTVLAILHAICSTPDMQPFYLRRGDYQWVEEKIIECQNQFLFPIPIEENELDFFMAEVKTASFLEDWIEEVPEDDIVDKYNIGPGDIRNKIEIAEWLTYSMRELGLLFQSSCIEDLNKFIIRIQNGVKEELLDLIKLKNIGRVRARALYQHGFHKITDLRNVNINVLSRIPSIGRRIAENIKQQLREGKGKGKSEIKESKGQRLLTEFE